VLDYDMFLIEILDSDQTDLEEQELTGAIARALIQRTNERMIRRKSNKPTNHLPSYSKAFSIKKELKW
jgi:hypothetical protein